MRGEVVALAAADYARRLEGLAQLRIAGQVAGRAMVPGEAARAEDLSLAALGQRVAAEAGCLRCHTVDGTPHIGPTWAGLYGGRGPARGRRPRDRRRGLPHRVDDGSRRAGPPPASRRSCRPTRACCPRPRSARSSSTSARCATSARCEAGRAAARAPSSVRSRSSPRCRRPRRRRRVTHATSTTGAGLRSWLLTTDHKRIGIMFLVATSLALLLGGIFALLLRIELLTPEPTLMSALDLQPAVHAARRDHGVAVHDPVDPDGVRQLLPADHARRARTSPSRASTSRASTSTCAGAVRHARSRWSRRRRHRLDVLRALQHDARRPRSRRSAIGVFILGISSIMTGHQLHRHHAHAAREGPAAGCSMPLFVWAIYATSDHPGARDAGARPVAAARRRSTTRWRLGHLRSGARRRPGALPAPLLVLLAPGGLHHDPAGDGRDQRGRVHLRHKHPLSYTRDRALVARHRVRRLPHLGPPHVRRRHVDVRRRRRSASLSMFVAIFSAIKVFTWIGTLYRGSITFNDADALLLRVPLPVRLRRA